METRFKEHIEKYLADGKIVESQFGDIMARYAEKIEPASKEDDMKKHIDIYFHQKPNDRLFNTNKEKIRIDVKGLKRHNQTDELSNPEIHWIELLNVNGKDGWLYGQADYFAFEQPDTWVIVKRTKVVQLCDEKIVDENLYNYKNGFYTLYRREKHNRLDIITEVPSSDLISIAELIIQKNIQ